ncbi:MAG: tRNA lysidine(34) synthetase TilS [Ignavibacteriales bacterium]|nr:tRNA lysidine(34) synthetase TilS [Ignavibacteriales bacterium]
MKQSLHLKISRFIRDNGLISSGDNVLVGVSGGMDSITLFHVLLFLRNDLEFTVAIAHFNYRLRGEESDEDARFVENLANKHNVNFFSEKKTLHTTSGSIQEQARELRYSFFSRIAEHNAFTKIATAHTADDNAETFLFNVLRGSGIRGMCGIPIMSKSRKIIRPLLQTSRAEIENYIQEYSLNYRTDSSNAKNTYTRNYLRNELFPGIRTRVNPNVTETLFHASQRFSELENFLRGAYEEMKLRLVKFRNQTESKISVPSLLDYHPSLQDYFFHSFLEEFSHGETSSSHVKALRSLLTSETGSFLHLMDGISIFKDRNLLVFTTKKFQNEFIIPVELEKQYFVGKNVFQCTRVASSEQFTEKPPHVEYIDAGRLHDELVLRSWNAGDTFFPLGFAGKKKLSNFFIDMKVPLYEKKSIPLFTSGDEIVWVCGKRLDDRYKITPQTKQIVKLEYKSLEIN